MTGHRANRKAATEPVLLSQAWLTRQMFTVARARPAAPSAGDRVPGEHAAMLTVGGWTCADVTRALNAIDVATCVRQRFPALSAARSPGNRMRVVSETVDWLTALNPKVMHAAVDAGLRLTTEVVLALAHEASINWLLWMQQRRNDEQVLLADYDPAKRSHSTLPGPALTWEHLVAVGLCAPVIPGDDLSPNLDTTDITAAVEWAQNYRPLPGHALKVDYPGRGIELQSQSAEDGTDVTLTMWERSGRPTSELPRLRSANRRLNPWVPEPFWDYTITRAVDRGWSAAAIEAALDPEVPDGAITPGPPSPAWFIGVLDPDRYAEVAASVFNGGEHFAAAVNGVPLSFLSAVRDALLGIAAHPSHTWNGVTVTEREADTFTAALGDPSTLWQMCAVAYYKAARRATPCVDTDADVDTVGAVLGAWVKAIAAHPSDLGDGCSNSSTATLMGHAFTWEGTMWETLIDWAGVQEGPRWRQAGFTAEEARVWLAGADDQQISEIQKRLGAMTALVASTTR